MPIHDEDARVVRGQARHRRLDDAADVPNAQISCHAPFRVCPKPAWQSLAWVIGIHPTADRADSSCNVSVVLARVDDVLGEYEEPRQVDAVGRATPDAGSIAAALVHNHLACVTLFAHYRPVGLRLGLLGCVVRQARLVHRGDARRLHNLGGG